MANVCIFDFAYCASTYYSRYYLKILRTTHYEKRLRECNPDFLKRLFTWWVENHAARRHNSHIGIWKQLRELYFDTTKRVMPNDVGAEVSNVSRFCSASIF